MSLFVQGARRASDAGLDGIELHSGNGYLFTQFISSAINDRNDEYGGCLENRFRFWREVIEGIRAQPTTRDMPLIVKLSVREGDDAVKPWRGAGNTLEESVRVARWCVEAGASAIHVTAGSIFPHPWNPAGYLPVDFVPRTYKTLIDSGTKTWLNYLVFRYGALRSIARLAWERTLRDKLYATFPDFLFGRQRPLKGREAGWRRVEGINRPASREIRTAVSGSVRARANEYRLSWDEANPGSRGLQDGQHGRGPPEMEQSAAIGGNMLMGPGARAEDVAQFIVCATEPSG